MLQKKKNKNEQYDSDIYPAPIANLTNSIW